MRFLRSFLFWAHLAVGVTGGLVILILSATGAALALKPQILNFVERDVRNVTAQASARLPVSQLMDAVRISRPEAQLTHVTVARDPSRAVAVGVGAERGASLFVDPYSGRILGEGSTRAQGAFRIVENWHRYLAFSNENRAGGRAITGAGNLAFLALALSGLYLWWPRKWTPQHTRAILAFRKTRTGRARDFNWHHVIGFWCAPAIIVMTVTGSVISYPWANGLLFRALGEQPPVRGEQAPRGGAGAAARREPEGRRAEGSRADAGRAEGRGRGEARPAVPTAGQIDRAWARAEAQMPSWSILSMRLGNGGPAAFTLTDGDHWNAFARSQLAVDLASGDVQRWQPYGESSRAQKVRGWFRFSHTGELGGLPGQLLAGIACLGGVVLVWTGLALAVRRLFSWRLWKSLAPSLPRRERDASVAAALQNMSHDRP